jgi:hypothetical protein
MRSLRSQAESGSAIEGYGPLETRQPLHDGHEAPGAGASGIWDELRRRGVLRRSEQWRAPNTVAFLSRGASWPRPAEERSLLMPSTTDTSLSSSARNVDVHQSRDGMPDARCHMSASRDAPRGALRTDQNKKGSRIMSSDERGQDALQPDPDPGGLAVSVTRC